ncbi:MAG: hypothetical protein KDJ38_08305 [Gammaproteobacteria bacterium]|nr:hypothetical protein [Gammaproteobacteria bacterium]
MSDEEIRPSVADPGEVLFRDARFVVKELQLSSAYSPRNAINEISSYVLQRSIADLSEEYAVVEMTMDEVVQSLARKLDFLSRPHPVSSRRNQDLLLRIELRNCRLLRGAQKPALTIFQAMGWRSISIIVDRLVVNIYSSERSPAWLHKNTSRLFATPKP